MLFSTCYDNAIIRFVTFYYITLDLYYDVFVALNNPSSNTRMTDFFMLSYIASLPCFINYEASVFCLFMILFIFSYFPKTKMNTLIVISPKSNGLFF